MIDFFKSFKMNLFNKKEINCCEFYDTVDKCLNDIFLNSKDIVIVGHRLNEIKFKDIEFIYFRDYYYDDKEDIFVGVIDKNIGIKDILSRYKIFFIESYVLFYKKNINLNIKKYYFQFINPKNSNNGILVKILKYKFSKLKEYDILRLCLLGSDEDWVYYCDLEKLGNG